MAKKKAAKEKADDVSSEQSYLGDMAPVTIAELEHEAKDLVDWKKSYKTAADEIKKRNGILMEMMKRNGQERYVCRNSALIIEIEEGEEKLKVTKAKADIPDPDD